MPIRARFHGGSQDGLIRELPDYQPAYHFAVAEPVNYTAQTYADDCAALRIVGLGLVRHHLGYEYPQTGGTPNRMWRAFAESTAATTITLEYIAAAAANTTAAMNDWVAARTYGTTRTWTATATYETELTPQQQARWRREKLEILRASRRARKTLIKFLDPDQLAAYAATGRFRVVASNGWTFELGKNRQPLLLGVDGHADASFCIHPRERFPDEDKILSLMLLLMTDAEEFLRIANRTNIRQPQFAPVPPAAPQVVVVPSQELVVAA